MGAQLRVYRRRIRSVQSTKKITRAQELIAASRIARAQQRVEAAQPYAEAITRAVAAVTAQGGGSDHPLLTPAERPTRAAVLLITSDRGLAGAYSANALKQGELLVERLRAEGKQVLPFICGRKGIGYYRFRQREVTASWSGFSEQPRYENAREVADALVEAYLKPTEEGGVDEIHVVFTEAVSALSQRATARRILPLDLEQQGDGERPAGAQALYEFEPSAEGVLDALLPRYVQSQVYAAFLQSALSESSSRRRAMKSASDNAEDLVKTLTRLANQARQAEITQEISEIVGGADALAGAGSDAR